MLHRKQGESYHVIRWIPHEFRNAQSTLILQLISQRLEIGKRLVNYPTSEIDLLALAVIRQYGFTSIFDAYYAATALNQVEDRTIISTDTVFDCIPGIKRIDPREMWHPTLKINGVGIPACLC